MELKGSMRVLQKARHNGFKAVVGNALRTGKTRPTAAPLFLIAHNGHC